MNAYKRVFLVVATIAALGVIPAFAQNTIRLTADVPFDFYVGGMKLPAGAYVVSEVEGSSIVALSDPSGRHHVFVMTEPRARDIDPGVPHLTFHAYGGTKYLATVWSPSTGGRELRKSRGEKEYEVASLPIQVATIQIAAR